MSKCKCLFSLVLSFLFLFGSFSVSAYASNSENLVNSDLRTWESGSDIDSSLIDPKQFFYDNINNFNRVNIEFPLNETTGLYMGNSILYELPEIKVSETYQFSFTFPNLTTIQTLFPHITNVSMLQSFFGNSILVIGVGYIDPLTNEFNVYDDSFFVFNTDDIPNVVGKTFTQTFNLQQIKGTPFFSIGVTSSSQNCSFFIQDVSLIKVQSDNDKKLDGILGLLQELWNSITGGFDRVQTKIGEVITNLSGELQSVKEGITTKLGEVITNLSGELQSVKEGITIKLGEVITGLTNELRMLGDNIINSIRNFFIPPDDYFDTLSGSFRDIAEDRFGALFTVVDILDNFFKSFNANKTTEYIDIPVYTFDIMGYPFSFGGWRFRFIPDFPKIKEIVNIIKGFTNILITFAFIEGLKSKYDEIFGGG